MKTKRYFWLGLLFLISACETTDPASLTIVNPAYGAALATPAIQLQGSSVHVETADTHPLQIEAMDLTPAS